MMSITLTQLAAKHAFVSVIICVALTIFLTFFIGVIFWTFRQGSQSLYKALGELPQKNEVNHD